MLEYSSGDLYEWVSLFCMGEVEEEDVGIATAVEYFLTRFHVLEWVEVDWWFVEKQRLVKEVDARNVVCSLPLEFLSLALNTYNDLVDKFILSLSNQFLFHFELSIIGRTKSTQIQN